MEKATTNGKTQKKVAGKGAVVNPEEKEAEVVLPMKRGTATRPRGTSPAKILEKQTTKTSPSKPLKPAKG